MIQLTVIPHQAAQHRSHPHQIAGKVCMMWYHHITSTVMKACYVTC